MTRIASTAGLLLALLMSGCGSTPPAEPPPIEPFRGYFESLRTDGTYLFETLAAKQLFDITPEYPVADTGLRFFEFIGRTGERVFINIDPNGPTVVIDRLDKPSIVKRPRIEQIARGYELVEDTQLFAYDNPTAPEPDEPDAPAAPDETTAEQAEADPTKQAAQTQPTP